MNASPTLPLVSCIMPTRDRRAFVPRALAYFARQDYPNRELIIVDDGSDSIADLLPDDPRIRYMRYERPHSIGAKRNMACQAAGGTFIAHWDDDDWMADWRLSYQVDQLLTSGADACGLDTLLFYSPASEQVWRYTYPNGSKTWVAGGTLCYTRSFWRNNPFPDISVGEDTRFVWGNPARKIIPLTRSDFYVALIHPHNTSSKHTGSRRWQAVPVNLVCEVMGDDLALYRAATPQRHQSGAKGMKLNLGCCDALLDGFVNVDVVPGPGVEVVDLSRPWPWPDSSVAHVRAWDVIEHLPDKIQTMNELWRVLVPGGTAEIAVPTTDGSGAFQDPTHVSFWNRRSFLYYEAGNPYRERFAQHYGIQARFRVVQEKTDRTIDGPRLTIMLKAVKP